MDNNAEGRECNRRHSKKPAQTNTENKVAKGDVKRKAVPNHKAETIEHRGKQKKTDWYGHMARLPEKTPAKRALREFQRYVRKPRGRAKTTWVETVEKDMSRVKVMVLDGSRKKRQEDLEMMAQNKSTWLNLTRRAMPS